MISTVVALTVALLAVTPPTAVASPVRLDLPAPTGKHHVGTTALHLVDHTREDPLAPTARPRELMVRLWYPAVPSRKPVAGYLTPPHSAALVEQLNALGGTDYPADLLTFPTSSRAGVPATGKRHSVVLLSHGWNVFAAHYTGLAEELASRGYVVAGIDHTFDAAAVEFPGGRVEVADPAVPDTDPRLVPTRVADTRFVLDRLTDLAAGRNPDAEQRRLPAGLGRALDLNRVAAVGHSMGSISSVGAMAADRRIDVGVALDGNPLGDVRLHRPFLMLGNQHHRRVDFPDWAAFYDRLRGPRLHIVVDGTEHNDLSDSTMFKSAIDLDAVFTTGPIDGERSLSIQRRYVTAWLDLSLHDRQNPLLAGESNAFPEVDFQP
jgi:dienelactone hydrolase